MSDTTNILDLPTDPVGGGSVNGNINMKAQETIQSQTENKQQISSGGMTLDESTISQIVNGLQKATIAGATQLPSRDIPMNTSTVNADPQVMPNYVPPPPTPDYDYIKNYEQSSDMINNYNSNARNNSSLDDMYNEIQTPLLLSVLYFLFQLPFFKKILYNSIPFLFANDGNYNLNGLIFISVIFGTIFYVIMKITTYFSAF